MGHYLKMFRFVALFALVAVAAAEPQWYGYAPAIDATHLKTANGDTVSVAAKKVEHHQLKAAEYAKKGYAFGYVKPAVVAATPVASYASPVVSYNGVVNPLYNTYAGVHAIGKREAEADSQWIYNAGVYANGYNGYTLPKVYNGVYNTAIASPVVSYNGAYTNDFTIPTALESTPLASVKLRVKLILNGSTMLEYTPMDTTDMPSQRSTTEHTTLPLLHH